MKKLINAPDDVVREALEGIEAAHGDTLKVSYDPFLIVRADAPVQGKVGIISGGGSGPRAAARRVRRRRDARRRLSRRGLHLADARPDARSHQGRRRRRRVLHIVKNYTGDV
jgi:dihydroxyacetone kinase-like protein